MKTTHLLLTAAFAVLASGSALAQNFTTAYSTKSALKDTSNTSYSSTQFDFYYDRQASDPDQYFNGINFSGTASDPLFGFDFDFESLNNFTYGSLLTGDLFQEFTVANRFGDVDPGIVNGFYGLSVDILGGDTNTSNDVLATLDFELEVIDSILLTVSATLDNLVVGPGQTTNLEMTVENSPNGTNSFMANSWFISSGPNSAWPNMPYNFAGNWFGATLNPGDTLTGAHSNYTPDGSTVLGQYNAYGGIIGGIYDGDNHNFDFDAPSFQVVPEPATLAVLGLLPLVLRRRKK